MLNRSGEIEQEIDLVAIDRLAHGVPVVAVLAVDRARAHAGPLGHLDLVPHQGEQRRHEDRRPGAVVAEQPRGDEVDGGLAPSGPLHEQDAPPVRDHRLDRLALAVAERGIRTGDPAEELEGVGH